MKIAQTDDSNLKVESTSWNRSSRWQVEKMLRRSPGDHVIELSPLRGRHSAPIGAPSIDVGGTLGRKTAFADPPVPDNLDARIVGERARQQLEGGKVPATHDDKSAIGIHRAIS